MAMSSEKKDNIAVHLSWRFFGFEFRFPEFDIF